MLAVLEVLETKPSRDVTLNLLGIVNMVRRVMRMTDTATLLTSLLLSTTGSGSRFECHGTHMSNRRHSSDHGE